LAASYGKGYAPTEKVHVHVGQSTKAKRVDREREGFRY